MKTYILRDPNAVEPQSDATPDAQGEFMKAIKSLARNSATRKNASVSTKTENFASIGSSWSSSATL